MIRVAAHIIPNDNSTFVISYEENELLKKIKASFGRVSAIRVARAFAKCSLKDAVEHINSLDQPSE